MVSDYFIYGLWLLVHAVAAIIMTTRDVYLLVYYRLTHFIDAMRGEGNSIEEHIHLKKLPQHVSVLMPSSQKWGPSGLYHLDVLVNLVTWSLATNISYVSFYDPQGVLVKREEELIHRIQSKMGKHQYLIWHGTNTCVKNGFFGPKIHVKIISMGRSCLVDSCKELLCRKKELTIAGISQQELISYEFPDPEVVIYFGKYLNLCGYPPWQIRLSEFVQGARHFHMFGQRQFLNVLKRYSSCQQRLGK